MARDTDWTSVAQLPNHPKGTETKFNIAELVGIEINSVNKFKERAKMFVPASA